MVIRKYIVVLVVVFAATACGSPVSPTPTPVPSPSTPSAVAPPSVIPAPAPASNAVLAISGYAVTVWPDEHGLLYFNQKFTLVETGNKSGATIQTISSSVDGRVTDETGPSCWGQP